MGSNYDHIKNDFFFYLNFCFWFDLPMMETVVEGSTQSQAQIRASRCVRKLKKLKRIFLIIETCSDQNNVAKRPIKHLITEIGI